MQQIVFQLESGNRWFAASEILLSAFRSADFPNKKGLLKRDYPRVGYTTMGLRIGKGFWFSNSVTVFQGSVGVNYLLVSKPIGSTNSWFGPTADSYENTASIVFPVQADLLWHLRKKKAIAFNIGLGWYFGNQSFGVFSAGIKMRLYASKD